MRIKDKRFINYLLEHYDINEIIDFINEDANPSQVRDAIKKRYKAEIYYWPEGSDGSERRIIEPVAYGLSKGGNHVVRAFQPMGDTRSESPEWKMFRLDRIRKWRPLRNNKFDEPPGSEYPEKLRAKKYNPDGDKGMSVCYLNADFERSRMRNNNILDYNKKRRDEIIANDPYYYLNKNVDNAIDATPEIRRRMRWAEEDKNKNKS